MGAACPCSNRSFHDQEYQAPPRREWDQTTRKTEHRPDKDKNVMKKYRMHMEEDAVLGAGASSICRKGTCIATGKALAIKVYKDSCAKDDVTLIKFKRQIEVLKELQRPLTQPADELLWNERLQNIAPEKIFMQIVDYSVGKKGEPGACPDDGVMYVITELGSYSLKDYLKLQRHQEHQISKQTVQNIAKSLIEATAGLHAKGLVHLDLKPENLMLFDGCLKIIDVDGCVAIGTDASIDDSSLSFSPCYCAPEWAEFLISDADDPVIRISAALDVWSIGMTICDLVLLDPLLKPMYGSFLKHGRAPREASFLFMEWLSETKKIDLPSRLSSFDPHFADLLDNWLLVGESTARRTLAEAMYHPFITKAKLSRAGTCPIQVTADEHDLRSDEVHGLPRHAPRHAHHKVSRASLERLHIHGAFSQSKEEDISDIARELHLGTLWKLEEDGDANDAKDWQKRDMWISHQGSLCYYSPEQDKRLVFLDSHHVHGAKLTIVEGSYFTHAFQIETKPDHDEHEDHELDAVIFGCQSERELEDWIHWLEQVIGRLHTMNLSQNMVTELRQFALKVKNRRMKVADESCQEMFAPAFKGRLWKVKSDGDRMKKEDWFERDMWVAKNGSLVYWSKKEAKQLIYYTSCDIGGATLCRVADELSSMPHSFQVRLPAKNGIEFAPGEFAAESSELREEWLGKMKQHGATIS